MHEGEVRLLDGAIAELGTEVASARLSQTQKKSAGSILGKKVRLMNVHERWTTSLPCQGGGRGIDCHCG